MTMGWEEEEEEEEEMGRGRRRRRRKVPDGPSLLHEKLLDEAQHSQDWPRFFGETPISHTRGRTG